MWEIANDMITWNSCNKCWEYFEENFSKWLPCNCNSCHKWNLLKWDNWIYSYKFFKKDNPWDYWKAMIDYNAIIHWVKFSDKQLNFLTGFVAELLEEDD